MSDPTHLNMKDHFGGMIPKAYEQQERRDVEKYLPRDAKVLEIGARFGVVSCTINAKLDDKTKHVAVEPDKRVWRALRKNRDANQCQFEILQGALSSEPVTMITSAGRIGAGSIFRISGDPRCAHVSQGTIPVVSYDDIKRKYFVPDTLVIDCEGAFVEFFQDFPDMIRDAKLILIEWDAQDRANNQKYRQVLLDNGFEEEKGGFHAVYKKK